MTKTQMSSFVVTLIMEFDNDSQTVKDLAQGVNREDAITNAILHRAKCGRNEFVWFEDNGGMCAHSRAIIVGKDAQAVDPADLPMLKKYLSA